MHHHRVDADRLQQHDILGKIARRLRIAHRMAAIFDHEGAPRIALEIGQRLDQHLGLFKIAWCQHVGFAARAHPESFRRARKPGLASALSGKEGRCKA